jgi:hypothetical protein
VGYPKLNGGCLTPGEIENIINHTIHECRQHTLYPAVTAGGSIGPALLVVITIGAILPTALDRTLLLAVVVAVMVLGISVTPLLVYKGASLMMR